MKDTINRIASFTYIFAGDEIKSNRTSAKFEELTIDGQFR
jgi:hypothetical protein